MKSSIKIFDNLMHAPCAICGATIGDDTKSFFFGHALMSSCSDKCFDIFCERANPAPEAST